MSLSWKLKRLRAMGAKEIVHRSLRWCSDEKSWIATVLGWLPAPTLPVSPGISLFPCPEGWHAKWSALYQVDTERLDQLIQGRIGFLGHPPLNVGDPVDWHRDPETGIRSPLDWGMKINYRDDTLVGNVKILWELGRQQQLVPLAVAYTATGEVRYRQAIVAQIEGWIDDNPYGRGIHWCSALELALRLISWAVVHSLLVMRDGSEGLFAAVRDPDRLGRAIYRQARFVRDHLSRYSSANNHLIGELTGLWVATQVFDMGTEGAHWATLAHHALEQEAQRQVYPDGADKEQAIYYHLWVLEYLFLAWLTGERCGAHFSARFKQRILAMAGFVEAVAPPDGQPPQIGDSDDGFVVRFEADWPSDPYHDVLAGIGHAIAGRVGSYRVTPHIPQKAFWYGMILGKLPERSAEDDPGASAPYPRIYPDSGYAVLGNGPIHLVFDAGALGYPSIAAHGHADALSICLALDGDWWLVDPGTYVYHSEPQWREYFRGTAAHNTVSIDGCHQSEFGGAFLWLRHAQARIDGYGVDDGGTQWVQGSHNGYRNLGVAHRRKVECFLDKGCLQITDSMDGTGAHDIAIYFHFSPDVEIVRARNNDRWVARKPHSSRELWFSVDQTWEWCTFRGSDTPIAGWYSPVLGTKVPAYTLRGLWHGFVPAQIATTIQLVEKAKRVGHEFLV